MKNPNQAAPGADFYMIIKNIKFTYHEYRYVVKITEVTCYKYVARRRRRLEMEIILQNTKMLKLMFKKYFAW